MKIATQNLILVTPIFLLLGLIASLLLFVSERREVRWGLDNEAQGIAVTIGGFVDPAVLAKLAEGSAGPGDEAAVRRPLERILEFGQARRIQLFAFTDGPPQTVLDLGERPGTPAAVPRDVLQRARGGAVVTRPVGDSGRRLVAYAPVGTRAGSPAGLVAVETSAAPVLAHQAAVFRRTAGILLALLVVGALVALSISRMIGVEIDRLARAARAFAAGDYDARLEPGVIEEVAEVGSTFAIMGSVLRDTTRRSTRQVRQSAQSDSEADLAESFAGRFALPVDEDCGGARLAIDRLGQATHGDFWVAGAAPGGHYACLGRVDGPASLDSVMTASAVRTLLDEGLRRGLAAADLLGQASELFSIHCCTLLRWSGARHDGLEACHLRPGRGAGQTRIEPAPGRTVVLTTLDERSDRQAVRYAETYAFESPRHCVNELRRLFGDGAPGGVLALQWKDR